MVKATNKKKNNFDYEADWVPHKGRVFKMKPSTKEEEDHGTDQQVFTPGSPFGLRPSGKRQDQKGGPLGSEVECVLLLALSWPKGPVKFFAYVAPKGVMLFDSNVRFK